MIEFFSVIENYIEARQENEPKKFEASNETRTFILISTVMTWALTKPVDPVTFNHH